MKEFIQKTVPWILVGILLSISIFLGFKKPNCSKCPGQTVTIHDTIEKPVEISVEVPVLHWRVKYDTAWKTQDIDTLKILADYFENFLATWFYTDTIQDSIIWVVVNDSVQAGDIIYREFWYRVKKYKEITITNKVSIPSKGFYLGAQIGGNLERFDLGPSISYIHDKNLFGASYSVLNKEFRITYQRKLSLRR